MTLHKRISEFLGIKYTCMYPNKCLNRIRSFRTHSTHTKKKNSDLMWTAQGILSTREMGWKGMVIFGGKKNKKKWKNPKKQKTKKNREMSWCPWLPESNRLRGGAVMLPKGEKGVDQGPKPKWAETKEREWEKEATVRNELGWALPLCCWDTTPTRLV